MCGERGGVCVVGGESVCGERGRVCVVREGESVCGERGGQWLW